MVELTTGQIAGIVGRTREAVRKAERVGRVPLAQRQGRVRFWRDDQVPAICKAFGVDPPPTQEERLLQKLSAALGVGTPADLDELCEHLAPLIRQAAETLLGDDAVQELAGV